MKQLLLSVKNLYYSYGEKAALCNVSLEIFQGEKIAVMGSNGAGKSTFFLNLNGVLKPDAGGIFFQGKKIEKKGLRELRRRVGFVFQDADSQIIAPTVAAEISFGPMNLNLSGAEVEKRVEDSIAYMDLGDLRGRPPHYLSGGEKKRVSIADILAMETEIMIFDEPMAALDPVNSENVEEILNRLHRDGRTLLIATHDVNFAYRYADRIVVFSEGRIIADGAPVEIFREEEVLERAHLKQPGAMIVWDALCAAGIVSNREAYPVTFEQAAEEIARIREGRS